MRARRGAAGMSLAELLVAVSLSAVVLLAGTWLLVMLLRHAAEQVGREPAIGGPEHLALQWMERDAQRAVAAPAVRDGWEAAADRLLLTMPDGALVIYHREDERLLRTEIPGPGEPERTKLLVGRVVGADFSVGGSLVHLWLNRTGSPAHHRVVLARNLGRRPPSEEELE